MGPWIEIRNRERYDETLQNDVAVRHGDSGRDGGGGHPDRRRDHRRRRVRAHVHRGQSLRRQEPLRGPEPLRREESVRGAEPMCRQEPLRREKSVRDPEPVQSVRREKRV